MSADITQGLAERAAQALELREYQCGAYFCRPCSCRPTGDYFYQHLELIRDLYAALQDSKKDAERYRYWRQNIRFYTDTTDERNDRLYHWEHLEPTPLSVDAEIDRAIKFDAAMTPQTEGKV